MKPFRIVFFSQDPDGQLGYFLAQRLVVMAISPETALAALEFRPSGSYKAFVQALVHPILTSLHDYPQSVVPGNAAVAELVHQIDEQQFQLLEQNAELPGFPASGIGRLDEIVLPPVASNTSFSFDEVKLLNFGGLSLNLAERFVNPDRDQYPAFGFVGAPADHSPLWMDARQYYCVYKIGDSQHIGELNTDFVIYLAGVDEISHPHAESHSIRLEKVAARILKVIEESPFWSHVHEVVRLMDFDGSSLETIVLRSNIPYLDAKKELLGG